MSPQKIEKIGSNTLLDKQWGDRPMNVISNPHKLSEVELYQTLQKIVELPEQRLKKMLKNPGQQVDEIFLKNICERVPQFLTVTLVNLTKTLLLQKDYFCNHPIWSVLEQELYKRKNNLNNEQLASVLYSFGITGNGRTEFYQDMEEIVTDSPIPLETEYLSKILMGYCEVDICSPVVYSIIVAKILGRGLGEVDIVKLSEVAKTLSKATNMAHGAYGFYAEYEQHLKNQLH